MPPMPGDPIAIRTVDVRVDYEDLTAVDDLSLEIAAGEVFGLIGPNGAGKTSTIRVLAGLQQPTYGEVFIDGIDVAERPADVHRVLGYMPDLSPVYDDLKCWELLDLFAAAHNIDDRPARIDACLKLVGLEGKRYAMAGKLSRGMTQRLVLAKTLLHKPRVMLLDEPASGLDPLARIELRNLLRGLSAEGVTILISSHILTELSGFCTSIGIMEKGRLVESGRIEDIRGRVAPHKRLIVQPLGDPAPVAAWLVERERVERVDPLDGHLVVEFTGRDEDAAALLAAAVAAGHPLKGFYERHMDVEDIVMKIGAKEVS